MDEHGCGDLWGVWALNQGAVQGQGCGWGGGDVSELGGNEGGDEYLRVGLREPPTTLTASWWAGYWGREGGGEGRATGSAPEPTRRNLRVSRHLCENLSVLHK